MQLGKGLKDYHKTQREEKLSKIDSAIQYMRDNKITINRTSLAEELGVTRRSLYADYITVHLLFYPEFNPALQSPAFSEAHLQMLQNQISLLEAKNKQQADRIKELKMECKAIRADLNEANTRYEKLLGIYQKDYGDKVVHF